MRRSRFVRHSIKNHNRITELNNRTVKKSTKEQGIDYYDFLRDYYSPHGQARSIAVGLDIHPKGSSKYKIKR